MSIKTNLWTAVYIWNYFNDSARMEPVLPSFGAWQSDSQLFCQPVSYIIHISVQWSTSWCLCRFLLLHLSGCPLFMYENVYSHFLLLFFNWLLLLCSKLHNDRNKRYLATVWHLNITFPSSRTIPNNTAPGSLLLIGFQRRQICQVI